MTLTPERRSEIEALALPLHPDVTGAAGRYRIARLSSYGQACIIRELLSEIDRLNTSISHIREYVRASTEDGYMSSVDIIDEHVGGAHDR